MASVFLCHGGHLGNPEAVTAGILFCGPQMAAAIFAQRFAVGVFAADGKDAAFYFGLETDKTFPGVCHLGGGFQRVLRHIHQQQAKIILRDGKVLRRVNPGLKIDLLPGGSGGSFLKNGVQGKIGSEAGLWKGLFLLF